MLMLHSSYLRYHGATVIVPKAFKESIEDLVAANFQVATQ